MPDRPAGGQVSGGLEVEGGLYPTNDRQRRVEPLHKPSGREHLTVRTDGPASTAHGRTAHAGSRQPDHHERRSPESLWMPFHPSQGCSLRIVHGVITLAGGLPRCRGSAPRTSASGSPGCRRRARASGNGRGWPGGSGRGARSGIRPATGARRRRVWVCPPGDPGKVGGWSTRTTTPGSPPTA